jgi:cytochrome P450
VPLDLRPAPQFRPWEEPDQFRPERWLSDAAAKTTTTTTPSTFYMPFATGPRNRVGQPLANVVMRTILARLVGEFGVQDKEVDAAAAGHIRIQAGFTVLPQGGMKLRFVPRRRPMTTTTTLSSSP